MALITETRAHDVLVRQRIEVVVGISFELRPLRHVPLHRPVDNFATRRPLSHGSWFLAGLFHEFLAHFFHIDVVERFEA